MDTSESSPQSKRSKIYYIYCLINPLTGEPYYVGCSTNPKKRLYAHQGQAKSHCESKRLIDAAILAEGQKPEMKILDQIEVVSAKLAYAARWLEDIWTIRLVMQGKSIVGLNTKSHLAKYARSEVDIEAEIARAKREAKG